jgi:hypothetical protein
MGLYLSTMITYGNVELAFSGEITKSTSILGRLFFILSIGQSKHIRIPRIFKDIYVLW